MQRRILSYVVVALIALAIGSTFQPFAWLPTAAQGGCQTFKETGKTLCGKFLTYWQKNGGLPQQGFPISNSFTEVSDLDGKSYTVQYFERAVFEDHPENPAPYDVLLSQLGTFQFKRKYPNGELGGPPPAASTPAPPPSATGAKLEVLDYIQQTDSIGTFSIIGLAKNTGGVQLASPKIVATLKNAGGQTVGSESDTGPGGMRPGDIWPFRITWLNHPPAFTNIGIQIEANEIDDFEKGFYYWDYQVSEVNVLPPGSYGGIKVLGTVKNTGSKSANLNHVYVIVQDAAGKTIDVNEGFTSLDTLGPGQSSSFSIDMNTKQSGKVTVAVYGFVK